MRQYRNATPNMFFTGVKDDPKPGIQDGSISTPLHLPLCPIVAAWGKVGMPILVMGDEYFSYFGSDTFDVRKGYYNHQTVYSKAIQSSANIQYGMRVKLPNMKKGAVRLCIEYVAITIPGVKAKGGDPKTPVSDIEGYKYRLVYQTDAGFVLGAGEEAVGTLTGKEGAASVVLPLFDLMGTYEGIRANNFGISISQPKANSEVVVDTATIKDSGNIIYRMFIGEYKRGGGTPSPWYTTYGNDHIDFALGENVYNKAGTALSFRDMYDTMYIKGNQPYSGLDITGPLDNQHIYQDNIDKVSELFFNAESAVVDPARYIHTDNIYSVNLFGDTDYKGVKYHALQMAPTSEFTQTSYYPAENSYFRPDYGTDGDISLANYDAAVAEFCDSFGKTQPNLADFKRFPFHFIWDSGFSVDTKIKLFSLMGLRPEIYVASATYVEGEALLSPLDELSRATQLAAAAAMYPESTIYKTKSTRAHIMGWACKLIGHEYRKPCSLNIDFLTKVCDYLGSSDGVWVAAKAVDTYPNNVISVELLNYNYEALPVREEQWGSQLIAVEYGDISEIIYSGLQTVNPNDSSVLNSFTAVCATMAATIACIKANRLFVGQAISAGLLIKRSNEEIARLTAGVDRTKAVITPMTDVTPEDNEVGYAWTSGAHVAANGNKTVNTVQVSSGWLDA